MDTPRSMHTTASELYRSLAKDFTPKKAEMRICKYLEELEARIVKLEQANMPANYTVVADTETEVRRGRPRKTETVESSAEPVAE